MCERLLFRTRHSDIFQTKSQLNLEDMSCRILPSVFVPNSLSSCTTPYRLSFGLSLGCTTMAKRNGSEANGVSAAPIIEPPWPVARISWPGYATGLAVEAHWHGGQDDSELQFSSCSPRNLGISYPERTCQGQNCYFRQIYRFP